MIIDSHAHIGEITFPVGKSRISSMPRETLLAAMEKYSITLALVSSIEGAEFDSDMNLIAPDRQIPQLKSMQSLIDFVKENSQRLKALLWVKPYTEKCNSELEDFIKRNRRYICGFKMHPTLSNLEFTDARISPYIELAEKFSYPILVHTEKNGLSDPALVEKVAVKYRNVGFIMAHLGMRTDNIDAIEIIKRNSNIYGDTCLVETENALRAIEECGSEKILFGTDTPVFGVDTYKGYMTLIEEMKKIFTLQELENVLFRNSERLFGLNDV